MRIAPIVIAVIPLCLAACAKAPKDKLQGKWLGDSVMNVSPQINDEVSTWAKGVTFEFSESEMTVTIPSEKPRTGKFDIEDAKGDEVTLRVARQEGGTDKAKLTFAEDGKLHWDIGQDRKIVLAKLQ